MGNLEKQIYDRSFNLKKYIEFRCGGQKELAEDLYGDTMLKVLKEAKAEKLKNDASLSGFMGKCAKTVISSYFRTEGTHKRILNEDFAYCINTRERSPEKKYEIEEEIKGFMKKAETKLGETCRRIIVLLLFQNMNHVEIASILDKDRGTISSHLLRIRRRLGDIHLCRGRIKKGNNNA